ncbi:lipoprotein [Massilia solisilvae]|uniref:Type IV secretion system putative lipoprotein virB7 n=1 Tax=Massilia solisilvae TaxID=1811225 RepID=A0ABT2BIB3_9BURK|nr:lipoprotein [Massilia solisilvae]MCS0608260.1 lipoprotein [Massilia solisilvae]
MRKLIFAAVGVAALAGCASTDGGQVASQEQTYTPLGTFVPRKNVKVADERKFMDKEEFQRQQQMMSDPQGGK